MLNMKKGLGKRQDREMPQQCIPHWFCPSGSPGWLRAGVRAVASRVLQLALWQSQTVPQTPTAPIQALESYD